MSKSKKTIASKTSRKAKAAIDATLLPPLPAEKPPLPPIRTPRHPFLPADPARVFIYRCDGIHHVAVEILVDLPIGWSRVVHVESHYDAGIALSEGVRWAVNNGLDVVERED